MANGKSENPRDAETGVLKSETETENFSELTEKNIVRPTDAESETPRPISRFCEIPRLG